MDTQLYIVWKIRNLTACHQSDTMTYLPSGNKSIFLRIGYANSTNDWELMYHNTINIGALSFLYRISRIGNKANYIKQTYVFNTK